MKRPLQILIAALGLIAVLSACGGEQSPSAEHLDTLLYPSSEQVQANFIRVEEEVKLCMIDQGFEYDVRTLPLAAATYRTFPRLGTFTAEQADESGFGFAAPITSYDDPNGRLRDVLTDDELAEWAEAFFRCRPAAEEEVNGDYNNAREPLLASYDDLIAEFEAEPAVLELETTWSTCMRENGFEGTPASFTQFVQSYLDAYNQAAGGTPGTSQTEREAALEALFATERAAASAAVACADPVRDSYNELWLQHQDGFVEENGIPQIPQ